MSSHWRLTLYSLALALMTPCRPASAQVVHTFDQVQTRLDRGDHVSLTDTAGRPARGTVADVSGLSLQLFLDGELRTFDGAQLQQIDRLTPDSVKNGVLWGLAIGAGAGLLGIVAAGASDVSLDSAATIVPLALLVAPAAGAAISGAADAAKVAREPIYVRLGSASNWGRLSWKWRAGHVEVSLATGF